MKARGITLIEILVAIAILLIVVSIVITSFSSVTSSYELKRVTNTVATILEETRSYSINSKNGSRWSVRLEEDKAIRYEGVTYDENSVTNSVFDFGSKVSVESYSLAGGGRSVTFDKITGKTDNYGEIKFVVTSATTSSSTIYINKTGIIEVR